MTTPDLPPITNVELLQPTESAPLEASIRRGAMRANAGPVYGDHPHDRMIKSLPLPRFDQDQIDAQVEELRKRLSASLKDAMNQGQLSALDRANAVAIAQQFLGELPNSEVKTIVEHAEIVGDVLHVTINTKLVTTTIELAPEPTPKQGST